MAARKKSARRKTRKAGDPLARLRAIIEAWPETSEKISHGAPTWWGGRKTFATYHLNHHGSPPAIWIKATHEMQAELVESDPEHFEIPPYVGPSGWVAVRLDRGPDWGMIASLLEEGYRLVAPKRALRQLDGED